MKYHYSHRFFTYPMKRETSARSFPWPFAFEFLVPNAERRPFLREGDRRGETRFGDAVRRGV